MLLSLTYLSQGNSLKHQSPLYNLQIKIIFKNCQVSRPSNQIDPQEKTLATKTEEKNAVFSVSPPKRKALHINQIAMKLS